jgi:hypothetical protein
LATSIGFDRDGFPNEPRGHGIGIAIEVNGEVSVNLGLSLVTAIRQQVGQRPHGLGIKALDGPLSRGAVEADLGHLVAPLVGLGLEIAQVSEASQGPKVVPDIVHGAFSHLALFLRLSHVASHRLDVKRPQELQKVLVETHHRTLPLDDRREHVVMDEFFGGALEKVKGLEKAAVQGVLPLRVGKFEIQQAAMTCNHRETVEFSSRVALGDGAEMAPVGLALHPWRRFEADDGWLGWGGVSNTAHVIAQNGDTTVEAQGFKTLANDHRRDRGIDLQETVDLVFERIEFTRAAHLEPFDVGIMEIFMHTLSVDAQGDGNATHREPFVGPVVHDLATTA